MTDRTIGGLKPRARGEGDLSRMIASNRTNPANGATTLTPATLTPEPLAPQPNNTSSKPPTTRRPETPFASTPDKDEAETSSEFSASQPSVARSTVGAGKAQVTVYLDAEVRGRARAAFRATSHLEGDSSWSHFVEKAIAAEVARREALHHDNEPYPHDSTRLAAGRPLSA